MEFVLEHPEGRTTDQKDYAEWSSVSSENSDDEEVEPVGYIIVTRPRVLKKVYKEILSEEELIP